MASFDAKIRLTADSSAVERQLRKVDKKFDEVAATSAKILSTDKAIIATRKQLLGLTGQQKQAAQNRLKSLQLQKAELSIQKRELQGIVNLEKQRQKRLNQLIAGDVAGGGASISDAAGFGQANAAQQQLKASKALSGSVEKLAASYKEINEIQQRQVILGKELVKFEDQKAAALAKVVAQQEKVAAKQALIDQGGTPKRSVKQLTNDLNTLNTTLDRYQAELKQATDQSEKYQAALFGNAKAIREIRGDQQQLINANKGVGESVKQLAIDWGNLAAAFALYQVGQFVRDSFRVATALESSEVRLRALSDGLDDYQQVQLAVDRSARLFNQTQLEAADGFGRAFARLRPLGLSLEQVSAAYEGFQTAALLSGTTAAEAAGAWTQLAQAIGAGALRGEELNSILDQAPALSKAIADELGIAVGQLKEYGKAGKISSKTVLDALVRVRNEGATKLAAALDTPAQRFKQLEIAGEKFKEALAGTALPAVTQAVQLLGQTITALKGPIEFIGQLANTTLGTVLDLINAATKPRAFAAAEAIRGGRLPLAGLGGISGAEELFAGSSGAFGEGLEGLKREAAALAKIRNQAVTDVLLELFQNRLARLDGVTGATGLKPITLDNSNLLGLTPQTDKDKATGPKNPPSVDDPTKRIAALNREISLTDALLGLERRKKDLTDVQIANNEVAIRLGAERRRINETIEDSVERTAALNEANAKALLELTRIENDRLAAFEATVGALENETALVRQLNPRKKEELRVEQEIARLKKSGEISSPQEETRFRNAALGLFEANQEAQKLLDKTAELNQLWGGVGQELINGVARGLELAVSGVDNLGEAFRELAADILLAIGRALILKAISSGLNAAGGDDGVGVFSALAGTLTSRATGGPLLPGQPSIVGENGAELFIPGQAGQVVPTDVFDATRSAIANGQIDSSSDAFAENAMALGNTSQILQERTRETQLAMLGSSNDSITVDVNTIRVGSLDVVSQEQFTAGMKQTAAKARSQVFADLKNKPAARAGIGLR